MKLPYIEAGEIVTTHGVRGEIKLLSWLDSPEMLCEFDRCRISGREYVMDSVRVQKTCNLVKLRGVDTMEDAQKLRGKTMELYREDISDELIFAAELVDVEVRCGTLCLVGAGGDTGDLVCDGTWRCHGGLFQIPQCQSAESYVGLFCRRDDRGQLLVAVTARHSAGGGRREHTCVACGGIRVPAGGAVPVGVG